MSNDLSAPVLRPEPPLRRGWLPAIGTAAMIILGCAVLWRRVARVEAGHPHRRTDQAPARPLAQQFVDGLRTQDWKAVRAACATGLKDSFTDEKAKKLAAAHPELADPSVAAGFSSQAGGMLTIADFLGTDDDLPYALSTFRYVLAKPGQKDGHVLTIEVRCEGGQPRVTKVLLDDQLLAER